MSNDFPNLSALKAGDGAAWDKAFCHLWPMALRAAQHPEACLVTWEAEDIANEAILELISQIGKVTNAEETKALVVTIAYRRAVSLARRKSAIKRRLPTSNEFELSPEVSSEFITNYTDAEQREMTILVRQALGVLDTQTRCFLMEKIGQNLTYQEISARHGVPLGTVCTKVARGLKKVRLALNDSPLLMKELKEYLR